MKDILALPKNQLKKHIKTLADNYYELYQQRVCLSCGADVNNMINKLRKHYNMTNFELKKINGVYKLEKGGKITISNNTMSDALALEFLSIRKERIELFSKYPENWEELVDGKQEEVIVEEVDLDIPESDDEIEQLRSQLEQYKMQELREMYPEIKATSKEDFITQVLND